MHCTQVYLFYTALHTGLYTSQCAVTCLSVSERGTQVYLSHSALSHAWHTSLSISQCPITCLCLNAWHTSLCMSQCPITCLSVSMRGTQVYVCHNVLSHDYLSQCVAHKFIYVTMSYHMFICLNAWYTGLSMSQCPITCVAHKFFYVTMPYHMFICLNAWHTDLSISQCAITCLCVLMHGIQIYLSHNVLSNVYLSHSVALGFMYVTMCYQMFICLNAWHTSLPIFKCTISCLSVSMRGTQV